MSGGGLERHPKGSPQADGDPVTEQTEGLNRFVIEGTFINTAPLVTMPFSGDVTVDNRTGRLLGMLHDRFGDSVVVGTRQVAELKFTKFYTNGINPFPIDYQFTKAPDGAWVGSYSYDEFRRLGRWEKILGEATARELPPPDSEVVSKEDFEFVYQATLEDIARQRESVKRAVEKIKRSRRLH